ncbi:hypothetical protein [Pseudoruegeria sp. HB172150]|uniref:hypothetical protein n=1 Tax=Pseudoruegeria sp. HB172150 TaxID=2721164 RepID=UPI001557359C|nr:hypothetical protein [Pseudoruegeria sp. HB172150]
MSLRFDGLGLYVSGDIFIPGKQRRNGILLGGRDDWEMSFYGRISSYLDLGGEADGMVCLIVPCALSSNTGRDSGELITNGVLQAVFSTTGGKGEIVSCRLDTVEGAGSELWWPGASVEIPVDGEKLDYFRRVRFRYVLGPGTEKEGAGIRSLFDPESKESIHSALKQHGIHVIAEEITDTKAFHGEFESADAFRELSAQMLIDAYLRKSQATVPEPDWEHTIVFAGLTDNNERNPESDAPPQEYKNMFSGVSYGFDRPVNRFRSRFGSVINVTETTRITAKSQMGGVSDVTWTLRSVTLHEIGHLLNLPHSWSRHLGHGFLPRNAEASASWVNYHSLYPVGPFARAVINSFEHEDQRPALLTARRENYFSKMKEGQYDEAEDSFIRHAPLNQIAQGGLTFLDSARQAPALVMPQGDRNKPMGDQLQVVTLSGGEWKPLEKLELWQWHASRNRSVTEIPPIPAFIRLKDFQDEFLWYSLATGSLQIVMRAEHGEETQWSPPRNVCVLDPMRLLPSNPEFAATSGLPEKAVVQPGATLMGFPWIMKEDVSAHFNTFWHGDRPKRLTFQVIGYRVSGVVMRSNIFEVEYTEKKDIGSDYIAFEQSRTARDREFFKVPPETIHLAPHETLDTSMQELRGAPIIPT